MTSVNMSTNTPRTPQQENMAWAHVQALIYIFESQKGGPLTVKKAMDFYHLANSRLTDSEFQSFLNLIGNREEPRCIKKRLVKLSNLFENYPEVHQRFGIFLPPNVNLQWQTRTLPLRELPELRYFPTETEVSEGENESENSSQKDKGNESGIAMDVDLNESDKTSDSAEKTPGSSPIGNSTCSNFLEKVEHRFQNDPEVFSTFLSFLASFKNKPDVSEVSRDVLETQIFVEVSDLFDGHDDLIEEFKSFVPNAHYQQAEQNSSATSDLEKAGTSRNHPPSAAVQRPRFSFANDPSIAPVYKYGTYEEHAFFDDVKRVLGYREVYDNFLRCLQLYTDDYVTATQLVEMAIPFLGNLRFHLCIKVDSKLIVQVLSEGRECVRKLISHCRHPSLLFKLKKMLGYNEAGEITECIPWKIVKLEAERKRRGIDPDIDYANGGRIGASYRPLPHDFPHPKCSGRTPLCNEVLNDTWISFPSFSEDSTFVTSCKTQYEEIIYRCEEERYELDMAIAANASTMRALQDTQKKMNRMSYEERQTMHLDDTLDTEGSTVLHQKALHRLYGEKTSELVEGLKRNPWVAVPIILKRLKAKDEEWRDRQKKYNDIWRAQIDKYYLKSLDHQGINFRQNDSKSFRPKSLEKEMEIVYIEKKANPGFNSAHFTMEFKEMEVFQDAINLMLLCLKKIPGVYRDNRRKIELVIRGLIPDFFESPCFTLNESGEDLEIEELSRDPPEEPMELIRNDEEDKSGQTSPTGSNRDEGSSDLDESNSNATDNSEESDQSFVEEIDVFDKIDPLPFTHLPYTLFFASKAWFIFFRQFYILVDRLSKLLLESSKQSTVPRRNINLEGASTSAHNTEPLYKQLIEKLSLLLTGAIEYSQFEEESRKLFGIHAFVSYTMDKLVLSIIRQLQQIITDNISKECTALFIQSVKIIANDEIASPMEASHMEHMYLKRVQKAMEEERIFKIVWHKNETTLMVELIDQESQDFIWDPIDTEKWSNYLDNYINGDSCELEDALSECEQLPVILPRNLRRMQAYWKRKVLEVETSWQVQQSSKFMKRNLMTNKKRRALALLSHPMTKMPRRSMVLEESVNPTISKSKSVEDLEHPVEHIAETKEQNPEPIMQKDDTTTKILTPEPIIQEDNIASNTKGQTSELILQIEQVTLEESAPELEEEENEELRVFITTEEDSEEPNLILVELSGDNEISMQEESVQETNGVGSKVGDTLSQSSEPEEVEKQNEPEIDRFPEPTEEESEAMVVDEQCDDSSNAAVEEPKECEKETDENIDPSSLNKEVVEDIGAEMDLSSRIEDAVEAASRIIETIGVDESKDDDDPQSDQECDEKQKKASAEKEYPRRESRQSKRRIAEIIDEDESKENEVTNDQQCEEKHEEKSTTEEESPRKEIGLLKRRIRHKPFDYSVRTRRNRSKQTYMGKRVKKGIARTLQSSKGRRRNKPVKPKHAEILNDPSFDYAYFSELSEEEKIQYLVFKYLDVNDDIEVNFKPCSYQMHFVQGCDLYLYRAKMLTKAKETHQSMSEIKSSNFNAWHRIWLDRYVTPSMFKYCHDWMMKSDPGIYKLVRVPVSDCNKPPYIPYYKYKIRYYKIDKA